MANFYADRGIVTINGKELTACKSVKCTVDDSVAQVDHMSSDYRGSGFKRGNRKVSGSFELDIPQLAAQIDMAIKLGQSVAVTLTVGGDKGTIKDLVQSSQDISASVGDAGKTLNFMALDYVPENSAVANSTYGL
jgi:hypothetical protein